MKIDKDKPMKKIHKQLLILLLSLVVLIVAVFLIVKTKEYPPSTSAQNTAKSATVVENTLEFQGNDRHPAIIFYPGALVDPKSYSIWADQLAKSGYTVYIVHFPLDLAILNANAATKVQKEQPYIIGGHSLGGTMAARYAHNHSQHLRGVFFLASYPEEKGNLQGISQPVLSITASNDGVLNWQSYQKAKKLLPTDTKFVQINGGNHAGFGSYGHQSGDHKAKLSNTSQQKQVAKLLLQWLQHIS